MKKTYLTVLLAISSLFIISAGSYQSPTQTEGFENLKVLPKDITKEKLDSVMANWSVSLGVKCNFCHVANRDSNIKRLDFASDANKHKDIARQMMQMTADLNANFFNFKNSTRPDTIHSVVCYTCHRGAKEPDANAFLTLIDSTVKSRNKK